MGSLGWTEILIVAVLIVLLFGARRLPEIGRGLGEGIRSFRSAMRTGDDGERSQKDPDGGSGGTA